MDLSPYYIYILIAAAAVFTVSLIYFIRKRRTVSPSDDPYIDALKKLIDRDKKAAFMLLQQAVKRGNAPTDAYIKLGELLRESGEAGKALQIHQSLTVKTNLSKEEKAELYRNLAEDYASLGRSDRAVKVLESAVRNSGIRDPQTYSQLAKQHHLLGEYDKAFDCLKDLKRIGSINNRELALYLTSSAEHLVESEDPKEARKLLQRALKLDPNCPPALLTLGNLEETVGRGDEAIQLWKQVAAVSPELAGTALQNLEKTLFQKGRFGEIEQIYLDVLSARNGDEAAILSLSLFYQKQGREEDALRLLEEFHADCPDSLGASIMLTSLYSKLGDGETFETFLGDSINHFTRSKDYICSSCGHETNLMRWHCPKCNAFDSFSSNDAN